MTIRLLLICLLLSLSLDAHAALDRVHNASGDSGGPCPAASQAEAPVAPAGNHAPLATPSAEPIPAARPTPAATAPLQRPGLRWHSFLPGMMK